MSSADNIAQGFRLDGKVAVVTGAGSGIGRETAVVLSRAGATVIGADLNGEGLSATCEQIRGEGYEIHGFKTDVAEREEVEALAEAAIDATGKLDVWVNCAAVSPLHSILDTRPEEAERTIAVNMLGPYWGCMAAGRVMRDRGGGAIVNISSSGGQKAVPNLAIYGMTKAAVNSLTWTAAKEFGPLGIRVNAIAPGWIETPATTALYRDASGQIDPALRYQVFSEMAAMSPLGRVGQPLEIALAILYFASDASSFITGQVLRVNGGEAL